MVVPVFRFAPSPNGEAASGPCLFGPAQPAAWHSDEGGRLLVRIEDTDRPAARRNSSQASARICLAGLELGGAGANPERAFRGLRGQLQKLWAMGAIYPCFCSRKTAADQALASTRSRWSAALRRHLPRCSPAKCRRSNGLPVAIAPRLAHRHATPAVIRRPPSGAMRSLPDRISVQAIISRSSPMMPCRA